MSEFLDKLMTKTGACVADDGDWIVSSKELEDYTNLIIGEKDKEIDQLKSQLFTAKAQNEIYRGALYDSH